MQTLELTQQIRTTALNAGFDVVGIAPAVTPTGFHRFLEWMSSGFAADMNWMQRRRDAYQHPDSVMPGTKSVIMAGMNYFQGPLEAELEHSKGPRVARYALGDFDYHDLLKARLNSVSSLIRNTVTSAKTRIVVDTAPLLERDFARLAGIGWFGKNTMLISRSIGSWFLLGAVLTDIELLYSDPQEVDYCGTCTRCLDACPTHAFPEPGVLDAGRCISYQTIENRFQAVPDELREGIGRWLFGCDVCQDVCPWNRFAPNTMEPHFQVREEMQSIDLVALLSLDDDGFRRQFGGTPLSRSGRAGLLRNAAIVLANSSCDDAMAALISALVDTEPLVRGAAAWALGRMGCVEAQSAICRAKESESDPAALLEMKAALQVLSLA